MYIYIYIYIYVYILKAVMSNKLRKFNVTSFDLLSGHRQTYALI